MRKSLKEQLTLMNEVDYLELYHSLQIASNIRVTLRKYNKTLEWFAVEIGGISEPEAKAMINGCYDFDLRIISKIDTIILALEMEGRKNEHEEFLTFPDYKYSKHKVNE
jgi:hypothetical protein